MRVTAEEQLAAEFETHRPYLHAIAFRVLGSHADADDAVQEAWLRLARAGGPRAHPVVVDGLPGLLVTVDGRPFTVLAFTIENGAITSIRSLTDPGRLAQIVPSWVA
jgi:hypothetical protein